MEQKTKNAIIIHSGASVLGIAAGLLVASGKSHNASTTISYIILGLVIGNALAAPITYMALKKDNKTPEPAKPAA